MDLPNDVKFDYTTGSTVDPEELNNVGLNLEGLKTAITINENNMISHDHTLGNGGELGSTGLTDGAVTNAKLADSSVNSQKIADGGVTEANIGNGSVTNEKLADGAVTNSKLYDQAVTNAKLGNQCVGSVQLANSSVGSSKINKTFTFGSQNIVQGGVWIIPDGIYMCVSDMSLNIFILQLYDGNSWKGSGFFSGGAVISDGSNMRLYNNDQSSHSISYYKLD